MKDKYEHRKQEWLVHMFVFGNSKSFLRGWKSLIGGMKNGMTDCNTSGKTNYDDIF